MTAPIIVDRDWAMSVFGVTYVHSGGWRDPVVELLGRQTPETVFAHAQGIFFSMEADAVRWARTLARRHADACVEERREFLARRSDKARLAVVRAFPALRRRYSELLSEDEILKRRESVALRLLRDGFTPRIERIPSGLRFPRVLQMGAEVFVVDFSSFLRRPVRIRTERIVGRTVVPASAGGVYDAVVRYDVSGFDGRVGYDTTDPAVTRLSRYGGGVEMFISRKRAEEFVGQLVERIERSLVPMREEAGLLLDGPRVEADKALRLVAAVGSVPAAQVHEVVHAV